MEHADFLTAQIDFQSSVDALQKGIDTTKAKDHDKMQFTQVAKKLLDKPLIDEKQKKVIMKFLEQDGEDKLADQLLNQGTDTAMLQNSQNPSAHAFDSHMGPIIQMFEDMKDKFEAKVADTEKHETDDLHEYLLLKQDLEHQRSTAQGSRDTKAEMKAKALQDAADSKGQLADVTATRDADTVYLHDSDALCKTKASDYEDRQKLRKEEIEALNKAVEILGGTPKSMSEEHLPQLIQSKAGKKALLQVSSRSTNPTQAQVAAYLQRKSKECGSKVLSVLAMRVAADPFKTVKKMVKDLIVKLMEEATEEAEHKGFCDSELQTNEKTRKAKTEAVEILTAESDELNASIQETASGLAELQAQISELDAAVAQATELRNAESAKNTLVIKDAQAAQVAVQGAMKVLAEFYDKASDATAMLQKKELFGQKKAGQPEIFDDKPYTGMGGDSGGVMGMIEVIQSDFIRLETETTAQEEEATREYQSFLNDSELDKTAKKKDVEHQEALKQDQEQALTEKKADLAGTQKELDSAMKYFEKLKPQCISTGESYEEKVARRKEEIESLQEALKILNGEDLVGFGFLQKHEQQ